MVFVITFQAISNQGDVIKEDFAISGIYQLAYMYCFIFLLAHTYRLFPC